MTAAKKSERKACMDGCSGHGACSETGACECVGYYEGDACERLDRATLRRRVRGAHMPSRMQWERNVRRRRERVPVERGRRSVQWSRDGKPWWGGDRCGVRICASPDCSGHAVRAAPRAGSVCADPTCSSGHVECDGAACVCDDGWIGESCEASAKGLSGRLSRLCKDGYGGPGCAFKTCESACSGHGRCRLMAQGMVRQRLRRVGLRSERRGR